MRINLKNARRASGLKVCDVAKIIGTSTRHYYNIEAGERTGKYEMWVKLSSIFGISQDILRLNIESIKDTTKKDD